MSGINKVAQNKGLKFKLSLDKLNRVGNLKNT